MFRFVILFSLFAGSCFAQSSYEAIGNSEAVVFKTEFGSWTAFHVGTEFNPTHYSASLDIQFRQSKSRNRLHFKIGSGPPVKFVTRRGKSFSIIASKLSDDVWSIDNFRFFNGESGSPVFNESGEVCGIVLGNYFKGRWHGRVVRLDRFVEVLREKNTVFGVFD